MSLKAKDESISRINPLKNSGKFSLSSAYSLTIPEILLRMGIEARLQRVEGRR